VPPDRQQQILDAADELFGERGYAGVSMRDVAARAGVNKGLLFYYFGSKDALFEQVLDRYYTAHRAAFARGFDPELPPRPRLHRAVDAYLDFIEQHQRFPRLVQGVIAANPDLHPLVERNLAMLLRLVQDALHDVVPDEGPLAARHFFLTLSGAVVNTFTYGPALRDLWGTDPLSASGLAQRRAHLHWLVDALLDALERGDPVAPPSPTGCSRMEPPSPSATPAPEPPTDC